MASVRFREIAAIFAGGCIGTLTRAELVEALPHGGGSWPWATFMVNVAGALILGYLATAFHDRHPPFEHLMPMLGTGLCGALTTFSTVQLELVGMLEHGHTALAIAYGTVSVAAGLIAVTIITRLERRRQVGA